MKKLWTLARKEILLAFRDRGSLISMLLTPFLLTLAIGAAFGGGGDQPLRDVPVLLLNRDRGALAAYVVEAFEAQEAQGLVVAEEVTDEAPARQRIDRDEAAALVILPEDFSDRLLAAAAAPGEESEPSLVEIYASPTWRIGTAVAQAIVSQVLEGMHLGIQGARAAVGQLAQGAAGPQAQPQLAALGEALGQTLLETQPAPAAIALEIDSAEYRPFRWVDYSAASIAVLFLMFAATSGGRSLLHEREGGTLSRLLITPNRAPVILMGKMAGVAATGVLQMVILWQATGLVGAYWGEPLAAVVAILTLVICATGLGAVIAAWARTPSQAGALGAGITLAGAAVSGSFFPRWNLPAWVRAVSLLTPNSWGIEIFERLQAGWGLAEVAPYLAGAMALALLYYVAATLGFRRQFSA